MICSLASQRGMCGGQKDPDVVYAPNGAIGEGERDGMALAPDATDFVEGDLESIVSVDVNQRHFLME